MKMLKYYKLYDWMILELGASTDAAIIAIVFSFAESGKPCCLSYSQFSDLLKVSRCNAIARITKLVQAGYLQVVSSSTKTNRYTVNFHMFASIENDTSASIENDTSASIENDTSASIENDTSASIENDTNTITENKQRVKQRESSTLASAPPSLQEVESYFRSIGSNENASRFCDYYGARGWKGIKDWKACARVWCSRCKTDSRTSCVSGSSIDLAAVQSELDKQGIFRGIQDSIYVK